MPVQETPDPITERCIAAVIKEAERLGIALEGRVWVKATGRAKSSYEVHAGNPKLGTLSHDQFVRADVEDLFKNRRVLWLWINSPADIDGVRQSWDDWSPPLFALRWAMGSLMDAAIEEIRLSSRVQKNGDDDEACPLRTLAYQIVKGEKLKGGKHHDQVRQEAAKKYVRSKSPQDKAATEFSMSGGTASVASTAVFTAFKRWMDGEIGFPSWKGPKSVIPIRADCFELREETYKREDGSEGTRNVCSMRILADKNPVTGEKQPKTTCYVKPRGDSDHVTLRRLLRGEYDFGDAKLIWDIQKAKWKIGLTYAMPRQAPKGRGTGYLAVRRSVQDVLFIMSNTGETFRDLQRLGIKMIHLRGQFTRRKSELRSILNLQGEGARGRGKKRLFRSYGKLQDKEHKTFDTLLKQLASAIRKAAEASQAKVIIMEDLSLPWNPVGGDPRFVKLLKKMPWRNAETILKHELDEHGIQLRKIAQAHDTTTCPACGGKTKFIEADDLVECENDDCQLLCQRPIVSAWRMFVVEGVPLDALVDVKRKASYIGRAIRQRRLADAEKALAKEGIKPKETPNDHAYA